MSNSMPVTCGNCVINSGQSSSSCAFCVTLLHCVSSVENVTDCVVVPACPRIDASNPVTLVTVVTVVACDVPAELSSSRLKYTPKGLSMGCGGLPSVVTVQASVGCSTRRPTWPIVGTGAALLETDPWGNCLGLVGRGGWARRARNRESSTGSKVPAATIVCSSENV